MGLTDKFIIFPILICPVKMQSVQVEAVKLKYLVYYTSLIPELSYIKLRPYTSLTRDDLIHTCEVARTDLRM